jgi:hypothetical protein
LRPESIGLDTIVVIEHQPPSIGNKFEKKTNTKSTAVAYQLAFNYATCEPAFVDPKLKNNIELAPHLRFDIFLDVAKTRYKNLKDAKYHARKDHSKANFLYLLDKFGLSHHVRGIPAAVMDDAADSFIQIFAYLRTNN